MQSIINLSKYMALFIIICCVCPLFFFYGNTFKPSNELISNVNSLIIANAAPISIESKSINTTTISHPKNKIPNLQTEHSSVWNILSSNFQLNENENSKRVQTEIKKILADRAKF